MAQTNFDTIQNNVGPIPLVVQHTVGDGQLVVGTTTAFNAATATHPMRVTYYPSGGAPVILKVTGATTTGGQTTLIAAAALEGTADATAVVGTNLFHNFTAGHLQDGYNAVNALDLAVVHASGNETVAGTKTFSSPPVVGSLTGLLKASGGVLSAASGGPGGDYLPGTGVIPTSMLGTGTRSSATTLCGDGVFRAGAGGSGVSPNGYCVVDVTPWIQAYPNDHAAGVQAAHDALLSSGNTDQPVVLYMPSIAGGYSFARPVLWGHGDSVVQGEKGATLITSTSEAFVVWQNYANADGTVSPGHYVDLFGVLDTATVTGAGQKYGPSTYANEVAINGAPTGGTFTLGYTPPYGSVQYRLPPLPWDATAAQVQAAMGNVQALIAFGAPTSGSVTVAYTLPAASGGGTGSFVVPYNCTAASAQTLANAAFGAGNCAVTGGAWPGSSLVFTFPVAYGAVPAMVVSVNALGGGAAPYASIFTLSGLATCTGGPLPATPVKYAFASPMDFDVAPQFTCVVNALTGGSAVPPTKVQAGQNMVVSFQQVGINYPVNPTKWPSIRQLTIDLGASSPNWANFGMVSPAPPAAPTVAVAGSGGTLAPGVYQAIVTTVRNGFESYPSAPVSFTVASSGQVPTLTFAGGATASGVLRNVYLTAANQGTALLYASAETAATLACSGTWAAPSVVSPSLLRAICALGGMWDNVPNGPNPWAITYDSNAGTMALQLSLLAGPQTPTYDIGDSWTFTAPFTPTSGLRDISWQVDLDAKTVQCWVDGVALVVSGSTAWATGASFRENDGISPLALGYGDQSSVVSGGYAWRKSPYLTVCGLQVRSSSRWQTVSTAQAYLTGVSTVDGTSHIYHRDRYFAGAASTMGMLPLTDAPGSLILSYSSSSQYGSIVTEQHLAYFDETTGNDWVGDVSFNDLMIKTRSTYGYALLQGNGEGVHVNRCRLVGGAYNTGSLNGGVNYVAVYRDCEFLYGSQGSLYSYQAVWRVYDASYAYPGKYVYRLAGASVMFAHGGYLSPSYQTDCIVKITNPTNPSQMSFADWQCDYEGGGPTYGYFIADASQSTSYAYPLLLRNFGFGTTSSGVPYVTLRGAGRSATGQVGSHFVGIYGCAVQSTAPGTLMVGVYDDAWTGDVTGAPPGPYQYVGGTKGSVVSRHAMAAPPTAGAWEAGKSVIFNTSGSGAPGWVCTQTGDFGGTPPVFTSIGGSSTTVDRISFVLATSGTLAAGSNLTGVGVLGGGPGTPWKWEAKAAVASTAGPIALDIMRAPLGTGAPASIFAATPSGVVLPPSSTAVASGAGFAVGLALAAGDEFTVNCTTPGSGAQYVALTLFNHIQAN